LAQEAEAQAQAEAEQKAKEEAEAEEKAKAEAEAQAQADADAKVAAEKGQEGGEQFSFQNRESREHSGASAMGANRRNRT
jgi:hypothetical protein